MKFAVDEATAVVEQACEAIPLLEKENISDAEYKVVTSHLLAALPYLDHLKYVYPHHSFPFQLYRIRSEKGIGEEESSDKVQTFSYPSPEKCETARANKKGCPVFYVADNPATALKEAGCEKGETVFLSQWEVKQAKNAKIFLFFDHPLPPEHPWEKIRAQQAEQFHGSLQKIAEPVKEKWQQLHYAFCKAFLGEDYQLSSLIGHELLHANKKPEVQILVYPSTVEGDQFCNLAIHPDFADAHLQMTGIWRLKVVDENFDREPVLLDTGKITGQNITWQPATEEASTQLPF